MIYYISNETLIEDSFDNIDLQTDKNFVCAITFDQINLYSEKINLNKKLSQDYLNGNTTKFESYEGFDYVSIKVPEMNNILGKSKKVCVYFAKNILLLICEDIDIMKEVIQKIKKEKIKCTSLSKILYVFFDTLTYEDTDYLEKIECEIVALEEALITLKKDNYLNKIILLRKKLLKLKHYYERLINIAESIEENDNRLIDKKTIKYFKMFTNRINRLYQGVNNLRDYVTQVREAYQAQIDINQNTLMKLFTVITTIFLPLSLIVGWYGMNLKMPEYGFDYSYPIVIGVCISIVIFCFTWFKKNNWL